MKRLWLGIGVLAALLAAGFLSMRNASIHQQRVCARLEEATQAAARGDWESAYRLTRKTAELWQEGWDAWAALSDHTELDEIDAGFARLKVYCRDGHATDFAAESSALARKIQALGDGHRLNIRNLL